MESFEVIIDKENFKIIRHSPSQYVFSVFNYAMFHIIKKNENGQWEAFEHRFGEENIPLLAIGNAIDMYYNEI
jgi:hypothetical protein